MNGGPVRTWRTYADDEWARITWTAADPLSVDEEPRRQPVDDDRGAVVGLALLLLAFAAGFAAGWWAS
jgi:hypothetical protein